MRQVEAIQRRFCTLYCKLCGIASYDVREYTYVRINKAYLDALSSLVVWPNRCKSLQTAAKSLHPLQIAANRCKSLLIFGGFQARCPSRPLDMLLHMPGGGMGLTKL